MVQVLATAANVDVSDIVVLNQQTLTVKGQDCLRVNIRAFGNTRKLNNWVIQLTNLKTYSKERDVFLFIA